MAAPPRIKPKQINEAIQALELHQADSKTRDEKAELILDTICWLQGIGGRSVGDYIAAIIAKEDQLNARARDIADQE